MLNQLIGGGACYSSRTTVKIEVAIPLNFRNDIPVYTDQLTEVWDLHICFILRVLFSIIS